jgi:ureidoacrylate peracid hydrolase
MDPESQPSRTNGRVVSVEAQPTPISLELGRTAVLVVDMQNDFGAEGGMFDRIGINLSMIQSAVGPTASVLDASRKAGLPIIYLKMGFRADLSDAGPVDAPNRIKHAFFSVGTVVPAPDGTESRILIRDTWNTEILCELAPQTGDIVLYKNRFSGFYNTELDLILQQRGIKYLLVTGCTTSVCVESTIRDAMFRDYSCLLLADCTGEPIGSDFQRSNHEASLLVIQTVLGWVSGSAALISALEESPPAPKNYQALAPPSTAMT